MCLSGLYEVDVGAGVDVDRVPGLVGGQQQPVVAALVSQPPEELRLRVDISLLQAGTIGGYTKPVS